MKLPSESVGLCRRGQLCVHLSVLYIPTCPDECEIYKGVHVPQKSRRYVTTEKVWLEPCEPLHGANLDLNCPKGVQLVALARTTLHV